MGWLGHKKQTPEPDEEEPVSGSIPWQRLIDEATSGFRGQGEIVEASRRVVKAQEASTRSANELGERIRSLNVWLLIFTVAICGLTVVLVLVEISWIKRPVEHATGGAWVMWMSADTPTYSSGFGVATAYPTLQECDAALLRETSRLKRDGFNVSSPKEHVVLGFKGLAANVGAERFSCLPDTVDPRGPKGK